MRKDFPLVWIIAFSLLLAACKAPQQMPDPHSAANDFLQKIGESRFQEAYESTAFAFQAQTTFRNFQATAKDLGLSSGTVFCTWLKDERQERDVRLSGEFISASGKTVPVNLTLIQERNAWRVFALRTPTQIGNKEEDRFSLLGKGDGFNSSANHELPSPEALQNLTKSSLLLFNEAAQKGDFNEFYSKVALAWQNNLTVKQLKAAFAPFTDSKVDISEIKQLNPVWDTPPEINSEGILNVAGHYATKPYRTFFALQYIFEFPYWKLYGIQVQIKAE
ncbi:MAG: hypothetical protein NTZ46_03930 [Verrucomicrobia bacterium]|nr:hypothetical protein [Verrucomicrobiota bacterium]